MLFNGEEGPVSPMMWRPGLSACQSKAGGLPVMRTDFFLNPAIRVLGDGFHLNESSPDMKAALVLTLGLQAAVEFAHRRERD